MQKPKKGKMIGVYPTAKERKQIEKLAISLGLKLSDYMRFLHRRYWEDQEKKNDTSN